MEKLFLNNRTTFFLIAFLVGSVFPMALNAQESTLRINEFMALNSSSLADQDGDFSDWIEIYNPTSDPISLINWKITDNANNLQKWTFPDVQVAANGYLVIFASGKNRAIGGQELHTNFNLSGSGEYLGLFNSEGKLVSSFDPTFPVQFEDFSYAWSGDHYVITSTPTPGTANKVEGNEIYTKPRFSHASGFYEAPFQLTFSSPYPDAKIYYTTDGSEPGPSQGTLYSNSISIFTTTVVRAVAVKSGNIHQNIATQTYFFLEDVINQPNDPPGYPSTWGPYAEIWGTAIADYEMDPEVTKNPKYANQMKESLLSLPALSVVTSKDNLFSKSTAPEKGGIYIYTGTPVRDGTGKGWERPASIELIRPDGSREFQVDAALELHGGHSRLAEKSPKHSFRVSFKRDYGPSRLEYPLFGNEGVQSFNNFNLRAGFGNTLYHHSGVERERWQFVRDIWAKDTHAAMGHPAGRNRYVHLYLNGLYWGIYNITERLDDDYAESLFGGKDTDYDIMKDYEEVASGQKTAWDQMMNIASQGLSNNTNYQKLLGNNTDGTNNPNLEPLVDPVNLADYIILNFYVANHDWDHHNWVAIRNRVNPQSGFKFFSWDAERIMENPNSNILDRNEKSRPSGLFHQMMQNEQFRDLFARRVQKHFFNGGILTAEAASERYRERAAQIEMAVIAESARWGDYRKDVHNHSSPPYDIVYTKDHWLSARDFMLNTYFPNRSTRFISQLKQKGWFPSIAAPLFRINGQDIDQENTIEKDDVLSLTTSTGKMYYTINGTDPKTSNGDIAPEALEYTEAINLTENLSIVARTLSGSDWSAISELEVRFPSDFASLKITEIHYNPLGEGENAGGLYEFIELKNTGANALDLSGVSFNEGVSYHFPSGTLLEAGGFIVLASSPEHFEDRYGFEAFGQYEGALDNAGEELRLIHETQGELIFIDYDDKKPWPVEADGKGYSLVAANPNPTGEPQAVSYWRASAEIHGSPGADDPEPSANPVAIKKDLEDRILLEQNFPNPFAESTKIKYTVTKTEYVQLKVLNLYGKEIKTLVDQFHDEGTYSSSFDAHELPTGVYIYQLRVGRDLIKTKKMVYLR